MLTLPQFCLRCVESRRAWLGLRPPLPPRNVSWSLARLVMFILGHVLVVAVVALILALLVNRSGKDLPAWPVWLLAIFAGYQALVGYGLIALCWNQRAARLRANPALDAALPPARYPVFRFLTGVVYAVLLGIITPAVLFATVENVRGEILWRRERARLLAQGERLEFRELTGPALPPDQNAGAAALFAPLFDYHYERAKAIQPGATGEYGEEYQAVWRDTNALRRLEERLKFPERREPKEDKETPRTSKVDLDAWAEAFRAMAAAPQNGDPSWAAGLKLPPSPGDPAPVVLAGLSASESELAALGDASRRPRSQFPVRYEESFACQLRHLSVLKGAQVLLLVRCAAHLETGENAAAFNDAENALRVAELLREDPLLISQLVRIAQGAVAVRTVWQGLAGQRWTDAQLAVFQEQLARADYLSGTVLALEGERACGIQGVNDLITPPRPPGLTPLEGFMAPPVRLVSRGLMRQNQVVLVRYMTRQLALLRTALSNAPQTGLSPVSPVLEAASQDASLEEWAPHKILVRLLAPATSRATSRAARAQTINRLAIVACALERHRLKHGIFPDKLDDLVPAFLPAPPLDPMNSQPFHYQRTDDGWFRIYSVGEDGQDDGGVLQPDKKQPQKDWPWPVPTRPEKRRLF